MNFKSNILYNKLSDEQLFALAQDGDTIAFNQLFTRYKKRLTFIVSEFYQIKH